MGAYPDVKSSSYRWNSGPRCWPALRGVTSVAVLLGFNYKKAFNRMQHAEETWSLGGQYLPCTMVIINGSYRSHACTWLLTSLYLCQMSMKLMFLEKKRLDTYLQGIRFQTLRPNKEEGSIRS